MEMQQLRRLIREAIDDALDPATRYSSEEYVKDPFISKVIAAGDPRELSAAKRAYEKASDGGKLPLVGGKEFPSAGAFFWWHDKKKEELKSTTVVQRSPQAARIDSILRTRDSTGRATARRR